MSDEIALTPDGRTFACVTHPDKAEASAMIELRDVDSGAVRCKFPYTDEETHIQSLSFSPKGLLLLSRGGGGTQLSWKTRSTVWEISQVPPRELASFSVRLWDVQTGIELASIKAGKIARFSPDGKTLATLEEDGSMKFWDVPFRKPSGKVVGLAMLFWTICLSLLMVARRLRVRWTGGKITM